MINKIRSIRNIGLFDNIRPSHDTAFSKLTLIYGENGRGKTTLANIFRSLGSNKKTSLIEERRRLGAEYNPHIEIKEENQTLVYQDGQWNSHLSNIAVFDDNFVVQNVCAGMEVSSDHRKNLHGLIIGKDGLVLNLALQAELEKIDGHNRVIREKEALVKRSINGDMSVDDFCKLPPYPDIEKAINDIKKSIKTAESKDVKNKSGFQTIELPALDIGVINAILQKDLPDLEQDAENMVKTHFAKLGKGAQNWVSDGVNKFEPIYSEKGDEICPFCAQSLEHSPLINHYKDYFSLVYNNLKAEIKTLGIKTKEEHDATIRVEFGQAVSAIKEATIFWKEHINISDVEVATIDDINAVEIVSVWKKAIESILDILRKKASAPLEKIDLPAEVKALVAEYEKHRQWAVDFSKNLQGYNLQIDNKKKEIGQANLHELKEKLNKLHLTRDRYTESAKTDCKAYLDAKEAKKATELQRDSEQKKLADYSKNIFKDYQDAINSYLDKFVAGFHLVDMAVTNPRGAKSCIYALEINNISVPVTADSGPSFKNTLSAGDRNTLALAFFFASLDKGNAIAEKIVVIDDPMTSLDEDRTDSTRQEIISLVERVNQVILLSHSKLFLYKMLKKANQKIKNTLISSLQINPSETGSSITALDIYNKFAEKHIQHLRIISEYITSQVPDKKSEVANLLRPTLETFIRVYYPKEFPEKKPFGQFIKDCAKAIPDNIILNQSDIDELTKLNDYTKKFHHAPDCIEEIYEPSTRELVYYCKKVLSFTRRPI